MAGSRIWTLGDSITDGQGGGGYRVRLASRLNAEPITFEYVGTLTDDQNYHHDGHGGWTAFELVDGFRDGTGGTISTWGPSIGGADICLLMIGTNDVSWGHDVDTIITDIGRVIDAVFAQFPSIKLIVSDLVTRSDNQAGYPGVAANSNQTTQAVNAKLPDLAASQRGLGRTVNFCKAGSAVSATSDGIHPVKPDGYNQIGDVFADAVIAVLQPTSQPPRTLMPTTREADIVKIDLPDGTYDIQVTDIAGQELREGVVCAQGSGYQLLPRTGQRSVQTVTVWQSGVLSASDKQAKGPVVPGNNPAAPQPKAGVASITGTASVSAVGPTKKNDTAGKYWSLTKNWNFGTNQGTDYTANTVHNFTELGSEFVFTMSHGSSDADGLVGGFTTDSGWWSVFTTSGANHVFMPESLKLTASVNDTACSSWGTGAGQCSFNKINAGMIRPRLALRPGRQNVREPIYIEVRAKLARGQGAWSSIWLWQRWGSTTGLLGSGSPDTGGANPSHNMFETLVGTGTGQFSNSAEVTRFSSRAWAADDCAQNKYTVPFAIAGFNVSNQSGGPDYYDPGFDMNAGFHTYGFYWMDGDNRVYVDGTLVKQYTNEWMGGSCGTVEAAPADLFLTLLVGPSGASDALYSAMNNTDINAMAIELDYVRVYEQTPTPPT